MLKKPLTIITSPRYEHMHNKTFILCTMHTKKIKKPRIFLSPVNGKGNQC